ncbi:MAG: translation initiation factor IF-2 [Calditerrivibrio sp.]|nr:translation initiation factor IF-2 [Calditerrivibrio sp.]MCA1932644.1 translation initiation factor IF-2 [Calditerrivibrio sp.]MCA1980420.1 translation initiation factor IF-2 [Calditerrivibrio sp.]
MSKLKISDVMKKANVGYDEIVKRFESIGKKVGSENDEFSDEEFKSIGIDTRILTIDKRQELIKQAMERSKRHAKYTEVIIKESPDFGRKKFSKDEILKKKMELNKSIQQLDTDREKYKQQEKMKLDDSKPVEAVAKDEPFKNAEMSDKIEEQQQVIKEPISVVEDVVVAKEVEIVKVEVADNKPEKIESEKVESVVNRDNESRPSEVAGSHPEKPAQSVKRDDHNKKPYMGKKPWQDRKSGQTDTGHQSGGYERRSDTGDQRRDYQNRPPRTDNRGRYEGQGQKQGQGGQGQGQSQGQGQRSGTGSRPPYRQGAGQGNQPNRDGGSRSDRPRPQGQGFDRNRRPDSRDYSESSRDKKEKSIFPPASEGLLDEKDLLIRKKKWEETEEPQKVEEVEVKKVKPKKVVAKKDKNLKKNILESLDELNIETEPVVEDIPIVDEKVEEIVEQKPKKTPKFLKERVKVEEKPAVIVPQKPNKIQIGESIILSELAGLLGVRIPEIVKKLMAMGIMSTANQSIDAETVQLIAMDYGIEVEVKTISEDDLIPKYEDSPEMLKPRPPIVTVMGHVDHGKTSLLDAIRKTKVAEREAGGITQHIGAYEVEIKRGKIVFLDTPGHEAFTTLRARGANVTDIVILVVAADDGVMPQTKEAIDHAKAAGVRIVVAINKIDKPNANVERVKTQLAEYGIISEEWGGEYQFQEISAKNGIGIDDLLERVLLEAEMLELKGNYDRPAEGIIIESRLDKQKGVSVSLIVKNGTLRVGDIFIAGSYYGKVRAMFNYLGKSIKEAGPSIPVEIMGFSDVPEPGETFIIMPNEKLAKQITDIRLQKQREKEESARAKLTLNDIFSKIKEGEIKDLNIILKADVQGSLEALKASLQKLSNSEVKVKIIHDGVGGINESDVLLALASKAIIIGFNVRPDAKAKTVAERESVDIRLYSVIYQAIEEVQSAIEGMLNPEIKENIIGKVEIRKVFSVPKIGKVAGCYVTEGKIIRNSSVRIIRDNVVVYTGKINSLKRFQDDVREVVAGYECGLGVANYNDIKEGDILEVFEMVEEKRLLKDVAE